MARQDSGAALLVASVLLSISIVGSGYFLARSIDRGSEELAQLGVKLGAADPARGASAAAAHKRAAVGSRYQIELAGSPIRGEAKAAVTIVEWADFQ